MFNKKAQGALEYLLIIGGVLLVTVIVITLVLGIGTSNKDQVDQKQQEMDEFIDQTIIPPRVSGLDCTEDQIKIYSSGSPTQGVTEYYAYVNNQEKALEDKISTQGVLEYNNSGEFTLDDRLKISVVAKKNNNAISRKTTNFTCKVK